VRKLPPNVDLLRSLPGLAGIRDRDLARLAVRFDDVRVPAGAVLACEGRPCHELVLVVAGTAWSSVRGERGGHVARGGVVGECAVLGAGVHRTTVVSRTPMHLLVAGCDGCRRLRDEPVILRLVARAAYERAGGGGWRLAG
jgi:CRP-like cAMP-binding protein